jgi:hypothetical protein
MGFQDDGRLGPDEYVTTFADTFEHERQIAEMFAAKDAEIKRLRDLLDGAASGLDKAGNTHAAKFIRKALEG